jgi:hypothetical protein
MFFFVLAANLKRGELHGESIHVYTEICKFVLSYAETTFKALKLLWGCLPALALVQALPWVLPSSRSYCGLDAGSFLA